MNQLIKILKITEADVGDILYTFDVLGDPYSFVIVRVENKTENGSGKWGRVFYDKNNNFTTEKTIAKRNGIFGETEDRKGFIIRIINNNDN